MHNITRRASALASQMFRSTMVLLALIFVLSYFNRKIPPVCDLKINSYDLKNLGSRYISFSPKIDLSPQFHLNVKQIFLYLKIMHGDNSDILWSKIIRDDREKRVFDDFYNNYRIPVIDTRRVVLELRGCIFPHVGETSDILYSARTLEIGK